MPLQTISHVHGDIQQHSLTKSQGYPWKLSKCGGTLLGKDYNTTLGAEESVNCGNIFQTGGKLLGRQDHFLYQLPRKGNNLGHKKSIKSNVATDTMRASQKRLLCTLECFTPRLRFQVSKNTNLNCSFAGSCHSLFLLIRDHKSGLRVHFQGDIRA